MSQAMQPFQLDAAAVRQLQADYGQRGVAVVHEPALEPAAWDALLNEALAQRMAAAWHLLSRENPGEIQQDNMRGFLGDQARGLLDGAAARRLLRQVTGKQLRPSWSASCYTYYDQPGSYMGEHCDKFDACRVALLVYLESHWPQGAEASSGLALHVFQGDSSRTPLVARVTARTNRVVILNGGEQAHVRPPLARGEGVVMLAGCYHLAAGSRK